MTKWERDFGASLERSLVKETLSPLVSLANLANIQSSYLYRLMVIQELTIISYVLNCDTTKIPAAECTFVQPRKVIFLKMELTSLIIPRNDSIFVQGNAFGFLSSLLRSKFLWLFLPNDSYVRSYWNYSKVNKVRLYLCITYVTIR